MYKSAPSSRAERDQLTCRPWCWRRWFSRHRWWWVLRSIPPDDCSQICGTKTLTGPSGCRWTAALSWWPGKVDKHHTAAPSSRTFHLSAPLVYNTLPLRWRCFRWFSSPFLKPTCTPSTHLEATGKSTNRRKPHYVCARIKFDIDSVDLSTPCVPVYTQPGSTLTHMGSSIKLNGYLCKQQL